MNAKQAKKIRKQMNVYKEEFGVAETSYRKNRVGVVTVDPTTDRGIYQLAKKHIKAGGQYGW